MDADGDEYQLTGALAATTCLGAVGSTGPFPDGTVIFQTPAGFTGAWQYQLPAGVAFFICNGTGGGGLGSETSSGKTPVAGPGGAGAGYFSTHSACSGQMLSGVVGAGATYNSGNPTAATKTTLNAVGAISLSACTANPGTSGAAAGAPGTAGTASGGTLANTTGHNGGLTNVWDGGGAGPTPVDQTAQGAAAQFPGGGAPGGISPTGFLASGAAGQIVIIAKTS